MRARLPTFASFLITTSACGAAGMGPEVRVDVTARMTSARPAIEACYHTALERNRKLAGMMVLSFIAAASTGRFEQLTFLRNDLSDDTLARCVLDVVGGLALATPQQSKVSITYPLDFAPTR